MARKSRRWFASSLAKVPSNRTSAPSRRRRGGWPRAGSYNRGVQNYEPVLSFGEDAAERYDAVPRGDEEAAVAFLEQLAGGGSALGLAIGTGRIALPLAARGISVHGIDISPWM